MIEKASFPGYKYLLTYQYASVIYDLTFGFCPYFLPGRELLRQRDQMVQAARSGKQNITEGYELQSLETYIKFWGLRRDLSRSYKKTMKIFYDKGTWPFETKTNREWGN